MKYQKYFYALCLLISLGACGEANPQNNNPLGGGSVSQNTSQASGDYALTQSSSEECRAIFNPHIRVQQTGSQLNIQTLDSSTPSSVGSNTGNPRSSFSDTSSPSTDLSETAGQIESIQGSIDAQGNLQLSGQLRVNGSSYAFQCSGNLAGDIASLSCQITGSPEAVCRLRYERSSSSSAPLSCSF